MTDARTWIRLTSDIFEGDLPDSTVWLNKYQGANQSDPEVLSTWESRLSTWESRSDGAKIEILIPKKWEVGMSFFLYIFLPTDDSVDIPVLISARFIPDSHRKAIQKNEGDGASSLWNTFLLHRALLVLTLGFEELASKVDQSTVCQLLSQSYRISESSVQQRWHQLSRVWCGLYRQLEEEKAPITKCDDGDGKETLYAAHEARLLGFTVDQSQRQLLSSLGLHIVADDAAPYWRELLEEGIPAGPNVLEIDELLERWNEFASDCFAESEELQLREKVVIILSLIEQMITNGMPGFHYGTAKGSWIGLNQSDEVVPFGCLRKLEAEEVQLCEFLDANARFKSAEQLKQYSNIYDRIPQLKVDEVLDHLDVGRVSSIDHALLILGWLNKKLTSANVEELSQLRKFRIFPTADGSLTEIDVLCIQSEIEEPVALPFTAHRNFQEKCKNLINILGVNKSVTAVDYILELLPKHLGDSPLTADESKKVLDFARLHRGAIADAMRRRGVDAVKLRYLRFYDAEFTERPLSELYVKPTVEAGECCGLIPISEIETRSPEELDLLARFGGKVFPTHEDVLDKLTETIRMAQTDAKPLVERIIKFLSEIVDLQNDSHKDFLSEIGSERLNWMPAYRVGLKGARPQTCRMPSEVTASYLEKILGGQVGQNYFFTDLDVLDGGKHCDLLRKLGVELDPTDVHMTDFVASLEAPTSPGLTLDILEFLSRLGERDLQGWRSRKIFRNKLHESVTPDEFILSGRKFFNCVDESWLEHKDVLVRIGVREKLELRDFRGAFRRLHSEALQAKRPEKELAHEANELWKLAVRSLKDGEEIIENSWQVIPTTSEKLVDPNQASVNDWPSVAREIPDYDDIEVSEVLATADEQFKEILGLKLLSSEATLTLGEASESMRDEKLGAHFDKLKPAIVRLGRHFGTSKKTIETRMKSITFFESKKILLNVEFRPRGIDEATHQAEFKAFILRRDSQEQEWDLHYTTPLEGNEFFVAKELVGHLEIKKDAAAHMERILKCKSPGEADEFLNEADIQHFSGEIDVKEPGDEPPIIVGDPIPAEPPTTVGKIPPNVDVPQPPESPPPVGGGVGEPTFGNGPEVWNDGPDIPRPPRAPKGDSSGLDRPPWQGGAPEPKWHPVPPREGLKLPLEAIFSREVKHPNRHGTMYENCLRVIDEYMKGDSGRWFDNVSSNDRVRLTNSNEILIDDVMAVGYLGYWRPVGRSVQKYGIAKLMDNNFDAEQCKDPSCVEHLTCILTRMDQSNDLWGAGEDWPKIAEQFGRLLRDLGFDFQMTGISKLLARKRPKLVPIVDSYIRDYLKNNYPIPELSADLDSQTWSYVRSIYVENERVIKDGVEAIRVDRPKLKDLSIIRILDIVLWKFHAESDRI